MTTRVTPRVCYLLSQYISHRRAGLAYRKALAAAGVDLVDRPGDADIVVIHEESPAIPGYFRAFPELHERYVISYSVWEASRLPERRATCLQLVDEVWTCSDFCRDIYRDVTGRVVKVPHIVDPPAAPSESGMAMLEEMLDDADDVFLFYTIGTLFPRKNLPAAIEAYRSLTLERPTQFVVKTDAPLPDAIAKTEGLVCLPGPVSQALIDALHHKAHCFVSAHCSEGWGLGITEAMAHGNLVISTGYGGCMEYLGAENALLVDYEEAPVQREARNHLGFAQSDDSARWAYVDKAQLAARMTRACSEWDALAPMRAKARADMERYRSEAIGAVMKDRLLAIDPADRRTAPRRFERAAISI